MASGPSTPRRPVGRRPRGRPPGSGTGSRVRKAPADVTASEPPPKKRRYKPGGPGGGGRFVDENGIDVPADQIPPATVSRVRASVSSATRPTATPTVYPRRERSTRIRTAVNRDEPDEMQYSSAAAVAAAVVQSEGYKPREERGWEEFHPNLDIEATFMVFHAEDVDGTAKPRPPTPTLNAQSAPPDGPDTPVKETNAALANVTNTPTGQGKTALEVPDVETPSRRRIGRPSRDSVSLYARRPSDLGTAPKTPAVLPIHNQTPKERLDLKQPSYRKTDRIQLFESKTFGLARYVDKSMMNAGYQESDNFIRDDRKLIKAIDANVDEDLEHTDVDKVDGDLSQHGAGNMVRVEYDMDEQDDMWLEKMNEQRKGSDLDPITREVFEITVTKIEKEWHALEKRIPKPNPKPPQTHRPRSSSAAAVNGEPQVGEEQDSKCAICDDGDCENTNAIVFCDGCDLAVHQECYGVPFIPEGQWLCRKCQLIGRGIPTCIFCPNTDGAFKQTNSSKWAHLLCAMWIPEVSLGNHTFMEPVMEVEKVPKTRWKLTCYICNQRMGACIQCSNKNCYQAFHVTCARRGRLYLKMKNSQGALAVLDGSIPLKAYCDKHCPQDYAKENGVSAATKEAKRFYKRTMRGLIWADSQASAQQLAATHRHVITEHPPDESQMSGAKVSAVLVDKKKGQPNKPVWKLPSGAPIIPQAVYDLVESSLARFPIRKRKDFVAEVCRYWTLKREARRGAALLKRLQLQMETFSSMELTRRNFAAMGPSGKARLTRRTEFAADLVKDLERLTELAAAVVERERAKMEAAELERDFVDASYFPVYGLLCPVIDKAFMLDRSGVFHAGLTRLQEKFDRRHYTTTLAFAHDFGDVFYVAINEPIKPAPVPDEPRFELIDASPNKQGTSEARDRKRLGKRILRNIQPLLETALSAEAEISSKPLDHLLKELERILEASVELRQPTIMVSQEEDTATDLGPDIEMTDAPEEGQIIVADQVEGEEGAIDADGEVDVDADGEANDDNQMEIDVGSQVQVGDGSIEVSISEPDEGTKINGAVSSNASIAGEGAEADKAKPNDPNCVNDTGSPPFANGFPSMPQPTLQAAPLTPPQSNGSFGQAQPDVLSEGGLPWYLKPFELQGTTAVNEQWTGRDAVRSLSEELTDMDDDALKDLEFDVDDDTITASPVDATTPGRKRANPAKFRKGIRSSARKR